jgi:hypothetical protein
VSVCVCVCVSLCMCACVKVALLRCPSNPNTSHFLPLAQGMGDNSISDPMSPSGYFLPLPARLSCCDASSLASLAL